MEATYYTPDIIEFHVGFEFEYKNRKGNWQKDQCGMLGAFHSYQDAISENTIRVRCLCQEDIEALGWVYIGADGFSDQWEHGEWWLSPVDRCEISTGKLLERHWIIRKFDSEGCYFLGELKNKSELSRIMRQIGMM